MNGIKKMITGEILLMVLLSLAAATGVTRPTAKAPPVQVISPPAQIIIIGQKAPDVQTTIYSADWCAPCQRYVSSVREKLPKCGWTVKHVTDKDSLTAHIRISKSDAEWEKLGIDTIPCTIIRKHGKEVKRFTGKLSPDELVNEINKVAKSKD